MSPASGLPFPPVLPDGAGVASFDSAEMLVPTGSLAPGVAVASTPPQIDFLYYPGQSVDARPDGVWSSWGSGCVSDGRYYSAIGDHKAPRGTVLLCEYDPSTVIVRVLVDVTAFLTAHGALADGRRYLPGKIHGRIDIGRDGWLYYATYMGGGDDDTPGGTGYAGDWILRTHPSSGQTEVVATFPIPRHTLPMSVLDADRMVFMGGTFPGRDAEVQASLFYAYDLIARRLLIETPGGPERSAAFSRSTGRLYWDGRWYDPERNAVVPQSTMPYLPYVRAATRETATGVIYGTTGRERVGVGDLWSFDVATERFRALGPAFVGDATYITSMVIDPTGRYIYYAPGAHGSAAVEGTPVVQFDTQGGRRKVLCFLSPYLRRHCGYAPDGTYGLALDATGERLFITWNGARDGSDDWDVTALTVVHIPESERP